MTDEPVPIDTSAVTLTDEIRALGELLAPNVHKVWAEQRLAEGWRYGPKRNDARKEHPCLVPYDELPESEKDYDRRTATEVVRGLLTMGCRIEGRGQIVRPAQIEDAASLVPPAITEAGAAVLALLEAPATESLTSLLRLWRARNPDEWSRVPEIYRQLGRRALELSEPLVAYDAATEGLGHWPGDVRLRQLQGLALARAGAPARANRLFQELQDEGHADESTLGGLARTHKDLAAMAQEADEREAHLRRAAAVYTTAYRQIGNTWLGINAATMALLLGEKDGAVALARAVRDQCFQELKLREESGGDRYWALAGLGEAALVLGEWAEAEGWYARAGEVGSGRLGDLSTTRRNARMLMELLDADSQWIERCLRLPRVAAFVGLETGPEESQGIDRPPRVPLCLKHSPQLEGAVRDAIRKRLQERNVRLGYASAVSALDLLFLEAILEHDGEAHVVLPSNKNPFLHDNGGDNASPGWEQRCQGILQRATEVLIASEQMAEENTVAYDYARLLALGLARIRAEQLGTEFVGFSVWGGGGRRNNAGDGAERIVERWRALGHDVELIDLAEILPRESLRMTSRPGHPVPRSRSQTREKALRSVTQVRAILFADVVGFSKLAEQEIPYFVRFFLGAIAHLAAPHAPAVKNTWGDGLYFVFSNVRDAGLFALELCDLVAGTNWARKGLPDSLGLRVALHAGPVYGCTDPVTGKPNTFGIHVNRAARIEPITPPNQVYASQAFAALAAAQGLSEFTCDYVGQTPLAKESGTLPTYHVRRRDKG